MNSARNLGIEKLYKYRAFNPDNTTFLETIFKHDELYFPLPSALNDPFECQFRLSVGDLKDLDYRARHRVWAYGIQKDLNPKVSAQEYFEYYDSLPEDTHLEFTQDIRDDMYKIIDRKWGIFSLSSESLNVLMWAHYANNHRGFCLEFDSSNDFFGRAWQVKYVNKINCLDILELSEGDAFNALLTKTDEWSYESEFRVLVNVNNELDGLPNVVGNNVAKFQPNQLSGIIFGARMSDEDISRVVSWLGPQHEHVTLKKVVLNPEGSLSKQEI
ncbi:DUF2971 domain-containing protein [Photobacterium sp. J15]|uniref:DUF2971 domain-containing protein n=1 Tax=Photobacterium sp. J15 TaxID=265901 RepID=UPI0018DE7C76|nr:DUF2971 domain-containing protein [Photobacterium sp. J15]